MRVTMPIPPWDLPPPNMGAEVRALGDKLVEIPVIKPVIITPKPIGSPVQRLVSRTFCGKMNLSDLDYIARALLQISDENHELRERVKALEAAIMEGGDD